MNRSTNQDNLTPFGGVLVWCISSGIGGGEGGSLQERRSEFHMRRFFGDKIVIGFITIYWAYRDHAPNDVSSFTCLISNEKSGGGTGNGAIIHPQSKSQGTLNRHPMRGVKNGWLYIAEICAYQAKAFGFSLAALAKGHSKAWSDPTVPDTGHVLLEEWVEGVEDVCDPEREAGEEGGKGEG
jgi:hypothetical protein